MGSEDQGHNRSMLPTIKDKEKAGAIRRMNKQNVSGTYAVKHHNLSYVGGVDAGPQLKRRKYTVSCESSSQNYSQSQIQQMNMPSIATSTTSSLSNIIRPVLDAKRPAPGELEHVQPEDDGHFMSRDEIDRCSPSRRDGIDLFRETYLRYSYCAFLQILGTRLELPQTTIGTSVVLCHRFFVRRSHASHDRFLIATAALFLAAKSEETARPLNTVLRLSYEICHKQDVARFPYLLPVDWFEQYRGRVLEAEHMILITLNFELTVQHPYTSLMSVFNKLGLSQSVLVQLAWNLVSQGLRSSLWLQFKPQHIAAGAVFVAARILNLDLSSCQTMWQEFQTTPTILNDVVQQLLEVF